MVESNIHIAAAGNWIVDKVKRISHYPEQDSLAMIREERLGNGGAPFNVLVDLARLNMGFQLSGIGVIGGDAEGDWIIECCQANGIDVTNLSRSSSTRTSYTDVMTDERTGRRTFFYAPAANATIELDDFAVPNATHVHYGYIGLLPTMDALASNTTSSARFLQAARATGATTSVDLVSVSSDVLQTSLPPVLPHTDILFLNELEAKAVTGINCLENGKIHQPRAMEALNSLLSTMPKSGCVILHASSGCLALWNGGTTYQPSIKLPQSHVVGASGAGDAFASGVLASRIGHGADWQTALLTGVSVAAASLRHTTCSDGVESLADCRALATTFGFV